MLKPIRHFRIVLDVLFAGDVVSEILWLVTDENIPYQIADKLFVLSICGLLGAYLTPTFGRGY